MNARLAQWLTRLYPPAWQVRYGEEFRTFLEARSVTRQEILNIIGCALYERVRWFEDYKMSKLQHSLVLMLYAYLAAIAAGVNLVMTVDDTPLPDAMHAHVSLSTCWNLVAAGSLVALFAVAAMGLPVLWAILRFAWMERRGDIMARLAFPPCALALILIWIIAVVLRTGWVPLFWNVLGGGMERWALSSVTLILVVSGLFGSAISLKQAIQRSTVPDEQLTPGGHAGSIRPLALVKIPALILAGSIVMMAAGVAGWGFLADQYAATAFRARDGFFGAPTAISWMGSLALFIISAVTALRGARWATTPRTE
jgi:hypothetical protein